MYQTEESWEVTDGIQVLRALAGQQGLRQFRMVEIALNLPTYRLDVVLPEKFSKDQVLRRFRIQTITEALQFVRDCNPVEVRLTLEPAFEDGKEDELRPIYSVYQALSTTGDRVHVCDTRAGQQFVIGSDDDMYDGAVSDLRRVWPKKT